MSTEIYYFSGTDNSLFVAKEIAHNLDGKLTPIASLVHQDDVYSDAEIIGIVFPVYLAHLNGIPLIVKSFIAKIVNLESKYLFAICTCGGYEIVNALPTLRNLAKLIRKNGGNLTGQFSVRLPMNNLDYDHIPVPISTDPAILFAKAKKKIDKITNRIVQKKKEKHRLANSLFNLCMSPMYKVIRPTVINQLKDYSQEPRNIQVNYERLIHFSDRSISVDNTCTGCGICLQVCPVQNIQMNKNKPVWLNKCEMCFACDEWCPNQSIHHWGRSKGLKYHHPDVKTIDIINQKKI